MLIDLHVHSSVSRCSALAPIEIIELSVEQGLDGVCITDHDTVDILAHIKEGFQPNGLLVLVGMEYTTPQGDFLVHGPVESLRKGMDASELLLEVERIGGAVISAHPFRGWRPCEVGLLDALPCTAIEVLNGRNSEHENSLAGALAKKLQLPGVAGSDAHNVAELGRFPTRFDVPVNNRMDLVNALKAGQCTPAASPSFLSAVG
ncbi:PHP-associated domain-containing protein [Pseudodesulfovibrio sediminis]|nr:PHP domain-containing protein [Pseudodesulfovibrio sediminis]